MNYKELFKSMVSIEEDRSITKDVIIAALHKGLEAAFRRHIDCPEAKIRLELIDDKDIRVYHQLTVVEDLDAVDDEGLEIELEDARITNPDCCVGDVIERRVDITQFTRASVITFKNILTQQIREAAKQVVYDEYHDMVDDLVEGTIQTVEDKFVLVDLGKTLALMVKNDQTPGEIYREGDRIKVVIREVNKEAKKAPVLVSRTSANLIKRLFERSVTEIFDGTVQVKAIAREAGERTKMAVWSKNANVDAVGSCIGPRGQRVSVVLEELQRINRGSKENIDIVEWNKDFIEYVKNVMRPANVLAVIPDENDPKSILIVVEDNQLSVAIGKKGMNARLAGKLLDKNINIRSQTDTEAMGIDWQNAMLAYQAKERARLAQEEALRIERERAASEALISQMKEDMASRVKEEEDQIEMDNDYVDEPVNVIEDEILETAATVSREAEAKVEETIENDDDKVVEVIKKRKPKLVKAADYVSKFEDLADASKANKPAASTSKKKRKNEEDEEDKAIKEKLKELQEKNYEIKPEYTEEELEAFENADDDHWYDDEDYATDEYDEMYEER